MAYGMDRLAAHLSERLVPIVSLVACGLLVFAFGAMIGSFVNVVVHRLPRGRSPADGRSHCPACGGQILAVDNIPVLSWLFLRGRCRACDAPISSRYPLVEAGCGLLFFLLAFIEIIAPQASCNSWWTPLDAPSESVALFAYHAFAATMLLTWCLLEFDGNSVPMRHVVVVLAVAVVVPMLLPAVHPVEAGAGLQSPAAFVRTFGEPWPSAGVSWFDRGLLVSAMGGAVAVLVAAAMERLCGPSQLVLHGLLLAGIVLGWQGAMWVGIPAAIVRMICGGKSSEIPKQAMLNAGGNDS